MSADLDDGLGIAFRAGGTAQALTRLADGSFLDVNDELHRLTGWSRAALAEKTLADVLCGDPDRWEELAIELLRHGRLDDAECRFTTAAGEERVGLLSSRVVEIEGTPVVLSSITDITDRKRAEDALQRAAELLELGDPFAELDRSWRFTVANRGFERLARRARSELVGRVVWDLFPDPAAAQSFREIRRAMDERVPAAFEAHYAPLGIWLGVTAYPTRAGVAAFARDITKAKSTEEALRASEERFRTVVENSVDGINILDLRSGRYTFMSPAQVAMTGFSEEELRDLPAAAVHERVHPEDRLMLVEHQQRVAEGLGSGTRIDYRWKVKSGEYRWFNDGRKLVRDAHGQPALLVGVTRDVTDRKRTEAALRSSEARHSFILTLNDVLRPLEDPLQIQERASHLLCDWLSASRVQYAETTTDGGGTAFVVTGAYGRDLPPLAGRRAGVGFEQEPCHDLQGAHAVQADVRADGSLSPTERERCERAGLRAWLGVHVVRDGRPVAALVAHQSTPREWTEDERRLVEEAAERTWAAVERARAGQTLNATRARLEAADRHKNEFLAILSHELRNPLAPIRNSVFLLRHAEPASESAAHAREVIDRQVQNLTRLVDDLLDVTRITRGKVRLSREIVDLGRLARRCAEDYRPTFAEAGVGFRVTTPRQPVYVSADPARLAQVISNLLSNAAKFTGPGGQTELRVEESERGAELHVADTGAGIAPELLPQLFEPFVQAEDTLDRSKAGLGLGLAVLKGLVELHGGAVRVASEGRGKGAEFVVTLPAAHGPGDERFPDRSRTGSRPRRMLVIEDNVDAAESLRAALELQGHSVVIARDGRQGVDLARHLKPDVVLCDLGLPAMDGFEVATALRADPALAGTRLVALSGYALPEDVERSLAAGFDLHLAKPVDPEGLGDI